MRGSAVSWTEPSLSLRLRDPLRPITHAAGERRSATQWLKEVLTMLKKAIPVILFRATLLSALLQACNSVSADGREWVTTPMPAEQEELEFADAVAEADVAETP